MLRCWLALSVSLVSCAAPSRVTSAGASSDRSKPVTLGERALRIHRDLPVFDGHNDLPWALRERGADPLASTDLRQNQAELQTDLPRLRQGGVGAQFWSVYVPNSLDKSGAALETTLEQVDLVRRMIARYPDALELASTADDVERIRASGKIASLMGIEGGYSIEGSLAALRMFHALGVRYMTLTHSDTIPWADSATDAPQHGGLTAFGEEVVREMNRIGMLVDVSHVSVETMDDVLRVSTAPIIASHSSAYALAQHPRNVPDEILRRVAQNRGVVMVNFASGFIVAEAARKSLDFFQVRRELEAKYSDPAELDKALEEWRKAQDMPRGTVRDVVDHVEHIARVAGVDHVGLGSDFDGIRVLPEQLDDVSCYPYITQELLDRGWSERDIRKVLGENALRVLREAERVARPTSSP